MDNLSLASLSFTINFAELVALLTSIWRLLEEFRKSSNRHDQRLAELKELILAQTEELKNRCSDLEGQVKYIDNFLQKSSDDYTSFL